MSITKTGIWTSDIFQENYGTYIPIDTFNGGYNSGSFTKSGTTFNITSQVVSTSWGSGISIPQGPITVPYGYTYRVIFDAYMTATHNITIDINNHCGSVSGNDHDTSRTGTIFSIPANTWTTVTWGASNTNTSQNPDQLDIVVYDGIGLNTANDNAATSWQMRNPKFVIYKDTQTIASIGKDGITHSNNFYEI